MASTFTFLFVAQYLLLLFFIVPHEVQGHRIRVPYSEHPDVRGKCWHKTQNRFIERNRNYTRPISFLECELVECLPDLSLMIERCPVQREKCPIRLGIPSAPFPRCCPSCDHSLWHKWNVDVRHEQHRGTVAAPVRC